MRARILTILVALDHMVFALITLGNCVRGETISASAWQQEQAGKIQGRIFRPLIDFIFAYVFWIEEDHCARCWLDERYLHRTKT